METDALSTGLKAVQTSLWKAIMPEPPFRRPSCNFLQSGWWLRLPILVKFHRAATVRERSS
ncbi:MAG: hypothetical protein HJJLKODD_00714 [Phycisphaerae bacterium]|nr:hypothetical protein [Phycisphaerae bacterium]